MGHGSSVLFGDSGVAVGVDEYDETSAAAHAKVNNGTEEQPVPEPPSLPGMPVHWDELSEWAKASTDREPSSAAVAIEVGAQLAAHSYVRVALGAAEVEVLRTAEAASAAFFACSSHLKMRHTGMGGRRGNLMLWSCGYSRWPEREQWHVVCGALDAQPWPAAEESEMAGGGSLFAALMKAEGLLRCISLAVLSALASEAASGDCADGDCNNGVGRLACLATTCAFLGDGTDPSVLDSFQYMPCGEPGATSNGGVSVDDRRETLAMAAHHDPGVLTLTRTSDTPGLELCSPESGWLPLEKLAAPAEVLVFAGEQLEEASGGKVRAANHRVAQPPEGRRHETRHSVVFELRAPDA